MSRVIAFIFGVFLVGLNLVMPAPAQARGCEGGICNVCSNCSRCRYCSEGGGRCSVCSNEGGGRKIGGSTESGARNGGAGFGSAALPPTAPDDSNFAVAESVSRPTRSPGEVAELQRSQRRHDAEANAQKREAQVLAQAAAAIKRKWQAQVRRDALARAAARRALRPTPTIQKPRSVPASSVPTPAHKMETPIASLFDASGQGHAIFWLVMGLLGAGVLAVLLKKARR